MADLVLDRIRILKTGLFGVERYLDMSDPANVAYFEHLAEPGTHLTLRRVKNHPEDPFRIEVFGPEGRFLGRVTAAKNETAARLMDAGLPLAAIVNESLPVHDSDLSQGLADRPDPADQGWNQITRLSGRYTNCNLPYSIYLLGK